MSSDSSQFSVSRVASPMTARHIALPPEAAGWLALRPCVTTGIRKNAGIVSTLIAVLPSPVQDAHMSTPDIDAREHGYFADATSVVENGARIGPGTQIWHHAHVRADAQIGKDCTLGKGVYVDAGAIIGHRCKIQNNVSVYAGVRLDDEVFVGPSAIFTNDLRPRAANAQWTVVPTHVGSGASIGANATIVCGNDIGRHAMVAAGAVVTRPVRDHQLVAGNPAHHLGWVCWCGEVVSRDVDAPEDLSCAAHRQVRREPPRVISDQVSGPEGAR